VTLQKSAAASAGREAGLAAPRLSCDQVERLRAVFGAALTTIVKQGGGRRAA
jgi:hypothetical protein